MRTNLNGSLCSDVSLDGLPLSTIAGKSGEKAMMFLVSPVLSAFGENVLLPRLLCLWLVVGNGGWWGLRKRRHGGCLRGGRSRSRRHASVGMTTCRRRVGVAGWLGMVTADCEQMLSEGGRREAKRHSGTRGVGTLRGADVPLHVAETLLLSPRSLAAHSLACDAF